jgi:hypothetical protein
MEAIIVCERVDNENGQDITWILPHLKRVEKVGQKFYVVISLFSCAFYLDSFISGRSQRSCQFEERIARCAPIAAVCHHAVNSREYLPAHGPIRARINFGPHPSSSP